MFVYNINGYLMEEATAEQEAEAALHDGEIYINGVLHYVDDEQEPVSPEEACLNRCIGY